MATTEYVPTTHDTSQGETFGAPEVPTGEPPWELHSWQLNGAGKIVALWGRTWYARQLA